MDLRKSDKTNDMVKITLKRSDDTTEDKKWVCKRMDGHPESVAAGESVRQVDESPTAVDENLNEKTEHFDNWYDTIPSYLEIEMKEGKNQLSRESSTENNASISMTHCPTSSRETIGSAGTSFNDPMDLSISHSKLEYQKDITNVSYQNPPEAHASKSNVYAEGRYVPSLTGVDRIIQGDTDYYLPQTMWSQDTPPMDLAIQRQINSGDAFTMAKMGIPSSMYNFPMSPHGDFPVNSGFVNTEKPEITTQGKMPHHLAQEAQSHLKTNYRQFSTDTANYGHCSNEPRSTANRSYSGSLGSEGNNVIPLRNTVAKITGDNFVNKPPQKDTNDLKRPSKNCVQTGITDSSKSVCPPRKKQSPAAVPGITYYCNICDKKFRNNVSYNNHLATIRHLRKVKQVGPQQSNLYNFQPNSAGTPLVPQALQAQPLPLIHPFAFQLFNNPVWHNLLQGRAITPEYLSGQSNVKTNNTTVQKSDPETSKTDHNKEPLGHIRSQNYFGTECYPHNPSYMNLPVSHTNTPQGIILPPNPQSENSMMANPRFLENKAKQSENKALTQSSQAHKDISVQFQPEGLTAANSFPKSGDVHSVTHHQDDLFRIYHCMVCSVFKTNSLQELELHIYVDRSRTPLELVIVSDKGLVCQLCSFITKISIEMAQHCTSESHTNLVKYYNHVKEGGIHRTKNVFTGIHRPFWVLCTACEYALESMVVLKAHETSPNHMYNVSCCLYIDSFSMAVEYCFCRPCNVKTPTKRELLIHARSEKHMKVLRNYPSTDMNFYDPRNLFCFKELSEPPRVSEQNEGSTSIGREEPHLRKEKNEENIVAENLASVNLGPTPSTSPKLMPVSCFLCQEVFPEISALVQHLQGLHGVNESGVKWIVSNITNDDLKVHEEKSLPEKELIDAKTRKEENITFGPDKSSAANEKLPIKRMSNDSSSNHAFGPDKSFAGNEKLPIKSMSNDSSSNQSSVVTGLNEESESSECSKTVRSEQNVATDENLNQQRTYYTSNIFSSKQFVETERTRNADKLDQNSRLNPYGRPCIDRSSSQEFYEKEDMRILDMHQERKMNIDSTSRQEFCETKNILPVEEKKVPNSAESVNFNSSQDEITAEIDSEPNEDGKLEIDMDDSSSIVSFLSTSTGSLVSNSALNTSIESNDSYSIDDIYGPNEPLPAKEKQISSAGSSEVIDLSSRQPDGLDSQNRTSSLEHQPNLNLRGNVDNDSCSIDDIYVPNERLPSKEKQISSVGKSKIIDSSSSQQDGLDSQKEGQFYAENSPGATDLRIQATKNIENIEISSVFSLRRHIDTDEDEEISDFDMYSDL